MKSTISLLFKPAWRWTTVLVLLGVLLTVRLGFWQLDRLKQKKDFNDHLRAVQSMPELDLNLPPEDIDLESMEYRQVKVSGEFDYSNQVAIRNQVWQQSWGTEIGFSLLTPLLLEDGRAVLVERGWIPMEFNSRSSWNVFDGPKSVSVSGILRLPMQAGEMGGGVPDPTLTPGQTGLDFWNYVNLERLGEQMPYPLLTVYVQQAPEGEQTNPPYASLPEITMSDGNHLGYAIQWFLYASLLILGYPVFLHKQEARQLAEKANQVEQD